MSISISLSLYRLISPSINLFIYSHLSVSIYPHLHYMKAANVYWYQTHSFYAVYKKRVIYLWNLILRAACPQGYTPSLQDLFLLLLGLSLALLSPWRCLDPSPPHWFWKDCTCFSTYASLLHWASQCIVLIVSRLSLCFSPWCLISLSHWITFAKTVFLFLHFASRWGLLFPPLTSFDFSLYCFDKIAFLVLLFPLMSPFPSHWIGFGKTFSFVISLLYRFVNHITVLALIRVRFPFRISPWCLPFPFTRLLCYDCFCSIFRLSQKSSFLP